MKNENVTLDEAALILKHTVSFYTGDSEKWARFLKQSAFLYKYDIINQFLIANYSYGRNVTAAASESEWKKLKASVNENAEGIPVVKKNNEGKREISHVYDISDTDSDYKIWQPDKTSDDTVKAVSNYFKASGDSFKAAVDNSILDIAGENFSPTDKDWNDLILNSIKYIVYTRCGLDTAGIATDSLSAIQNFHSVDTTENLNFTLNSLNKNILKPAEKVLRGIERSVIAVDRQRKLTAEKEKTAKVENSNIIGNTAYRYIANKTYRKIESSLTGEISKRLDEENIKFSGKINSDNTTTITFNRQDLKAVQQIIGQAKNKGRFFTDEQVQAAKAVSLVDYLGYRGEKLKRVGNNEYTLPEHDSMRISGNKYYWNSRSKGGNSVDFCMNYYNMTFQEAVKSLLDYSGNLSRVQPQAEKETADNTKDEDPAKPIPFPLSEKTGRVFKYLTESRGLSADMVNSLINEGKIAQDINGNAVFKVFSKNGELSGAEVSGTSQRRYKQTTGLDGNGFTVNPTGTYTPEKAIFFESAIDLLSYYELHKDETALLISMGGLKDKTVLKVMEDYSLSGENCFVAVDNDEAGVNFTNKMKNEYNINAYPITEDERFNLHENIKDWNDLLKAEKEDKTEHLTAYHTTNVDFDTFKPGYRGVIWTEKNLDFAKSRMANMGSDRIFTCDVTMKNPKHITYNSGENWDIDSTIRKARGEGYDGVVIDFKLADDVINNSLFQFVLTRNLEADARDILYSIVKANASDALENETLKDFFDRVKANNYITHSYVAVFKPEQVKIINKILINEQPEISSAEQESETDLKNTFEKALQNHETFYIKHTEENFENYRIAYDDKENHYNIIADRIYPIAKIRESNIIEESLAADIDVDSVIDIIKSYDSEISSDNLKTADQIQEEKQLMAQNEQTVITNFIKNYINSDSIFCPNLDFGEFFTVTNELFYYENSTHNVDEKSAELAAKYRNGENISTELGKHLDCETHIKIDADEERYDAGLPNDKDLYADIFVTKNENGLTFKFGDTKRFCTWEEYGKGQFEYLKESFRGRILSEYASEETAPPQFNSYGEELPEPEREMPKEQLDRLLARLDGKELTANLVGEFYEFYGKDAQAAAEVLGFKLTHKNINGVSVPMVGFPRFSLEHFRSQLTDEGYVLNINKEPENSKNLSENNDSFSVYQLKSGDETRYHRYTPYDDLQKSGLSVDNSNYNLVYKAPIEPKTSLENIFFLLNTKLPEDFKGHSLSVSDIIVLHKDGQDKAYYVDSVGFKEVPEFLHQQEISKEVEKNENIENNEKSSIHFGLLGNGITVYDVSREKDNDYLTVAHISDEGTVKYYVDDLKETDKELIQEETDKQKTAFTEKWNELSVEKKYDRILASADTNQLVQITGDMISTGDRVKKYEHSVIFKDEDFPKEFKSSIIGNTPYRYIPKKQYKKINNDSDFTNSAVEKIGSLFESAGIKYSGIIRKDFTTITFSKNDIEKAQPIIDSVVNQKVEADKKVETIEENAKIEKKAENTDVENTAEKVAPTITQTDIDSVLSKGSGFQSGKYRIYRQFQKQEKSKVNADFLRDEYGIGGGTHIFPDDVRGWSDHNAKGITIRKYGTFEKPDVKMNWSQVEKQIKKLIYEDRYFTDEEIKKYPEFLKSVNAPQYEIDNFIKSVHQKFIQSKSKLPPAEKRDSLALRLSDFIRDLDGYEKSLLKNVDRADLADVTADEMEKHLSEPDTVQQLMDFLKAVQWGTSDVYYRGNSWYFRQELAELFPVEYVCKVGDLVFMDSEKYEVLEAENNRFLLQNADMPLDRKYVSNEKLQEKLKESTQNDDLKAVKISKQGIQETSEEKSYIPIYKNTGKYASENGETDLFRAANRENRRCREAIEKSITENFDGMHLDKNAVVGVVEQFGVERVSYLLAATIKAKKDYDKRFSNSNIKWADTIDTSFRSPDSFSEIINSHSTILDEFIKQFRESIEKYRELEKPPKEKAFEDIADDVNKPVEYFTPTVKAVINDLSSISGKRYNVQIWSSTDGKNYTNTGNGRYFNDLDRAKSFAEEIIEGKYNDIIAFTAKYDEIYKELGDSPEKLNEYKITGEDFDEAVNNDSYNYYLKYISVRGDDFVGDREQTAFVLALNEISRQKNLDISEKQEAETAVKPESGQDIEITVGQAENFHITDYDLGVGSPKEKYNRNIEAIKTLFKIENENRQATPEEQEILSKYVGWGGLPEVFDSAKSNWHNEYEEVKSLLSDSEYRAAKSSTLNAHYTTPLVISSIYKVLESSGFKGGKILEPAMGIGNFFGLLPESIKNSELYGVELDSITGRIAKQLYPNADIQVKGFEKTDFDSGFFDAAVGNVPFGNYRLYDEEFHNGELIHDFFFKKSLDKVRPGGLVAFVTSKGTLDKADTKVREYLAQRADLLGAIRLPNTAFKKNANTEVTADILFLKKRENLRDFEKDGKPEWTETTTTLDGLPINSYFVSHPQMVLGEMKEVTRRYGKETACLPFENKSLDVLLEEAVSELGKDIAAMDKNDLKNIVTADTVEKDVITENENIKLKEIVLELNKPVEIEKEPVIENVEEAKPIAESPKKNIYPLNYRNFCYCNIDGDIYYRENKNMEKQDFSKKHIKNAEERVKGMIEISGCLQELIRSQKENYEDEYIIKQQNKLNNLYEDFTEKYGLLSDKSNRSLFLNDDTYPLLQSLENINSKGELESKADIFTKRTIVPYVEIDSVDTAAEALAVSISEKAGVDIGFMARLCSKTNDEVINDLEGVIFKNPVTEKYETSDEYLSGNVREKLRTAEIAAKKDSSYNINVSFLKEAQPKDLTPEEISVQLGSTWVPTKYYEQFMYELLDTPDRCQSDRINAYSGDPFKSMGRGANSNIIAIDYNNYSATYAISNKENFKADKQNFKAVETYGTSRINAYKIIEDTLNMKTVKIVDYFEDINGKVKAVPNEKETILAQEKQALIKSKFREWIFDDAERTADLCKIYNEKFNSVRPREYSGKHINFVGMNPEIQLKEHQKNAIAHTLYGKNALLAHSVGAGKTYEMVASAMENKRLGLCTKSLIVVPKHIVNQTAKEFLQLYPAANILVPNENDFTAKNRQKFCSRISTGNYDAIIISHNQFEKIPLSIERQIAFIEEEIDEITKNLEMLKNQRGERGYTVKDLERTRKNLENTLETLNNNKKRDTVVTFEELGVDKLYVDEVQAFKNLFLVSKMGRNVAGINTSSRSQRATDLYMKCQYLDEKTGSKGTVFATGTPLSNSMTELYTMQKYLQQDELKARGLNNFDSWASCFGETQTALELAPEGKGYQMKTRFSRFFNLPELMSFFKETADIKVADELNLPVPKANFHNIATEPSRFQQDMVSDLAVRAKRIRDRQVRPEEDNMLKVTNDGRKLALDQRIANPLLPDDPGSKVNICIDNVFDIWKDTAEEKSTQLIFCDLSTPGGTGFNVYNDIKSKLIDKGILSEEIAFIHDCKTDKQKQELFTKVNNGEVRVLLGSTSKMGTGTNCQQRLKALHHIDCPYRPSDLEQRNGRIIRQGNSNKEVDIYSYVTKGTFDSYLYQLVENKQKFISQIMTNKSPVRSADDVDESVLNYSQIKALAAGDPKIKEKMDLDIDLARLRTLFADYQSTKRHLQNDILNKYSADIKQLEQHIEGLEKDIALGELTKDKEFDGITIYGKNYTDKKEAGTALISACQMFPTDEKSREIGEYRGFKAILSFDSFTKGFNLTLKNATSITVPLGQDPYGNFTRLNNAIANFPKEMETHKAALENTMKNLKNAKEELTKPFARIDELHEKEKRLAELNKELTMGNIADTAKEEQENEANIAEVKNKPVKAEYATAL